LQVKPHEPALQVAVPFEGGVQSAAVQQLAVEMQLEPHILNPPLQVKPHEPALQVAAAFEGGVQSAAVQQLAVEMQPEPHVLNPLLHVKPQLVPSQVAMLAFAGTGQAEHIVPHESMLAFGWHSPKQSCVPDGHWPLHASPTAMQTPPHGFVPGPHDRAMSLAGIAESFGGGIIESLVGSIESAAASAALQCAFGLLQPATANMQTNGVQDQSERARMRPAIAIGVPPD
jgi:hypothetical protein